jgi:DedD protein
MTEPVQSKREIWITPGHLAALGAATFFIALLAFFVGIQVGRGQASAPTNPKLSTLVPDAKDQDALEALLREVDAAQSEEPALTFTENLSNGVAPAPPTEDKAAPAAATDVEPPPAPPPEPPPAATNGAPLPTSGWAVQIASYDSTKEADSHVASLVQLGHQAYRVAALISGRTWYRVRVGGFATKQSAEKARVKLSNELGNPDLMLAEAP